MLTFKEVAMKTYMALLFTLGVILVMVVGCGCSNVMTAPAYAWPGDAHYTWPVFHGTDNGGPDNGYMTFYNQGTSTWTARKLIAADLLDAQWTPQRQGIGWDTDGVWNVSFVEDTSNDLEIWVSQGTQWQDAVGVYLLLDDDAATNYSAVDVETRQNYVWALAYEVATGGLEFYIDLSAGVPIWVDKTHTVTGYDNLHYSIVLDDNLYGGVHEAYIISGTVRYEYAYYLSDILMGVVATGTDYPQIIADGEERLWVFATGSNQLSLGTSFDVPADVVWNGGSIYTADTLTDDYHATWYKGADDTIHVTLVDFDSDAFNNTFLIYLRRTPNGWSAPITLLTVDSNQLGDKDTLSWPQITVDPFGAIFIYYIRGDDWTVTDAGDLQGYYLDSGFYADFAVPGNWVQHTNIDGEADLVEWCVAPDSIIPNGDM